MPKDHPRYKEGIIGTGEPVWKDITGNPTVDATKRAFVDAVGELVSSDVPDTKPTPAIGWKIDLKNMDGGHFLNKEGQPGWTTYTKNRDTKPIFTGREYPLSFPKVAATIKHLSALMGPKTLEENGTQLLTKIAHHLEKWLKKGTDFGTYNASSGISLEVLDRVGGESRPGILIKQGNTTYKIVSSHAYARDKGRHAWSIFIDTKNIHTKDISTAKNFKLLPEGDSQFVAKICLDTEKYTELSDENIALLSSISTLLESLSQK